MGNQESSEVMMSSPSIAWVIKSLNLETQKEGHSYSMVHRAFASDFMRADKAKFDRSMNPFCPVNIVVSGNWVTGCFVNPLMAICVPIYLLDNNEKFDKECEILPVFKDIQEHIQIKDAVVLNGQNISLIILEKPYWRAGWAGISYIKDEEQLRHLDLRIVHHPEKTYNKQNNKLFHNQAVSKLKISKHTTFSHDFTLKHDGNIGALVSKIVNKKPYLIGAQISQSQLFFFNEKTYKQMQQAGKKYIRKHLSEKQILKQMDMHEFEIQTQL